MDCGHSLPGCLGQQCQNPHAGRCGHDRTGGFCRIGAGAGCEGAVVICRLPPSRDIAMTGVRSRRGVVTAEAGTAVGKTRIRRAGAVRFAARPRPGAGYSTGCGADRRKQFRIGNESPIGLRSRVLASAIPILPQHDRDDERDHLTRTVTVSCYGVVQHGDGHDCFGRVHAFAHGRPLVVGARYGRRSWPVTATAASAAGPADG